MRGALLAAGLAALGLSLGATQIEGACLERVARSAERWAERARRVPAVVPVEVGHASLSLGGGTRVARRTARARTVERIAIPEGGPVVAVAEGASGELAIGAFDGGAWRLAPRAGGPPPSPRKLAVDDRVNDLAYDPTGTLWAATAGGAWRVAPAGPPERLAAGAFQAVAIWKGRAWFASPRGLSASGPDGFVTRGREQGVGADNPAALAACGTLLCVGALDGLWLFDGTSARRLGSDAGWLPSDWVTAVAAGAGGGIWAGTFDAGLARLSPDPRRFAPGDGLPEGRVQPHALAWRDGAAFAGTPAGILVLRQGTVALVAEGLPAAEVTALAPARDGGLWMGFADGAARVVIDEGAEAAAVAAAGKEEVAGEERTP